MQLNEAHALLNRLSKVAATGVDNWSKVLKSNMYVVIVKSNLVLTTNIHSGNICFSPDRKWLLVDNLAKGFDLYDYPRTSPTDSFHVARTKAFVYEGVFLEDETSIACGSDHGYVHIFSRGTSACLQKLQHGSSKTMVQILNVCHDFFMMLFVT